MLVSKPTHGGGAPLGIDLEAGVAKITVRRPAPVPEPEQEQEQEQAAAAAAEPTLTAAAPATEPS